MKFKKEADKLYSKIEREINFNGEINYYKKRKVNPVLNEDGSIKWFNLITGGSWWKLIGVILFILIALGFIWEYHSNFQVCIKAINELNQIKNPVINFTLP